MEKAPVYFTDMRCQIGVSLQNKLERLMKRAAIDDINFDGKFTAIKIHFGEPGNLSFLRPNFSKTVADRIKSLGGKPFLTDASTLYVGRRRHALEHLEAAYENGYSPFSTGCHILIADGLKGTDDIEVPVPGGEYCKTARIGTVVMDADIIVSLTHFKMHELTGVGGAVKNIGMGCGSRAGKMLMHNEGKPVVAPSVCRACGVCKKYCAQGAIRYTNAGKANIDTERCVGCGRCIGACSFDAIHNPSDSSVDALNCKIVEYAKAVLHGRPHFHISIVNQVSPYCDCHSENDAAVVPDIGMFASFDPVALDAACTDAVNAAPIIPGSLLAESARPGADHFGAVHPVTKWNTLFVHAEKIGLGSKEYELITI